MEVSLLQLAFWEQAERLGLFPLSMPSSLGMNRPHHRRKDQASSFVLAEVKARSSSQA